MVTLVMLRFIMYFASDISKQLAQRIKTSSERKNQRLLAYTKSDSDIMRTLGRHKFFRYKVKSYPAAQTLKRIDSQSSNLGNIVVLCSD